MNFASWKDGKSVARELKAVYRAADADESLAPPAEFEADYPSAVTCFMDAFEACIAHLRLPIAARHAQQMKLTSFFWPVLVDWRGTGDHGAKSGLGTGRPAVRPDQDARSGVAPVHCFGPFGCQPSTKRR